MDGKHLIDISEEAFAPHRARSSKVSRKLMTAGDLLLVELSRERTGRMRDVAATIQREQDRLIRAPHDGILVVQGAPGTGKTAVGLHRAAYLLFTLRRELERTGVLVVGPDPASIRYIERVLPSLGETTVVQRAINELPGVRIEADEPSEVLRLKGDSRMASLLERSLRRRLGAGRNPCH